MSASKRRRLNSSEIDNPGSLQLPPALPAFLPDRLASPPSEPLAPPPGFQRHRENLVVMKFGGSSLAGADHLARVGAIIRSRLEQRPIVVLSAMGKTTNLLLGALQMAMEKSEVDLHMLRSSHEKMFEESNVPVPESVNALFVDLHRILSGVALLKEVSARTRDLVVSFGERLSVRTFAAIFNRDAGSHIKAKPLDSWEIGMQTTSGFGSADSTHSGVEILPRAEEDIRNTFAPLRGEYDYVPFVTGYIAKDVKGVITTLGRDGSDLTATFIGASVQASEVQIWKDVSGILTADPRLVSKAKPVSLLTFEEAAELSNFGAAVVHPAAVLPAWSAKVPISVRNSLQPDDPGTRIVTEVFSPNKRMSKVAAISSKKNITMVMIRSTRMLGQHGFLAKVFQIIDDFSISVDVITTSEVTVSLTLDQGYKEVDLDGLRETLSKYATVDVRGKMSTLTLLTPKKESSVVLQEAFTVFRELGVNVEMVSHGASKVNVTFVLSDDDLHLSIKTLHQRFFEDAWQ